MVEAGCGPGLPLEAREPLRVLRELLRQHLDGHVAVELLVVGPVDLPHSARADLRDDAVVPQGLPREIAHCEAARTLMVLPHSAKG